MSVSASKRALFVHAYARNLRRAVEKYPLEYTWDIKHLPAVVNRMDVAIALGTFNKDGYAMKWTCKELGIPHTYKAISAYLEREA